MKSEERRRKGKRKERKIEGKERERESLYAPLLALLPVTKASIKIGQNAASVVCQETAEREETETQRWHTDGPCNTNDDVTNTCATHKPPKPQTETSQIYKC